MQYSELLDRWRAYLRNVYNSAPEVVQDAIQAEADAELEVVFPGVSPDSETGKKTRRALLTLITARKLGLSLPVHAGHKRPIPWIPLNENERKEWRRRLNMALSGLTSDQQVELDREIAIEQQGPRHHDIVADEVAARYTQVGG